MFLKIFKIICDPLGDSLKLNFPLLTKISHQVNKIENELDKLSLPDLFRLNILDQNSSKLKIENGENVIKIYFYKNENYNLYLNSSFDIQFYLCSQIIYYHINTKFQGPQYIPVILFLIYILISTFLYKKILENVKLFVGISILSAILLFFLFKLLWKQAEENDIINQIKRINEILENYHKTKKKK